LKLKRFSEKESRSFDKTNKDIVKSFMKTRE
jgi:hypothetical protein